MGLKEFIKTSRSWIENEGAAGIIYSVNQLWMAALRALSPLFEQGTNIYEKEWDVLVILDGCRVDAIAEVADEFAFLDNPGTHRSTGSTSGEWMRTTFTSTYEAEIKNTIYVTANGHSSAIDQERFFEFEDLYNYGWNSQLRTVPAEIVTDVAIEAGRENVGAYERMIIHYMQPHFPSVPKPIGHGDYFDNVWKGLMVRRGSREVIWEAYIANLRYVLDSVGILLENIDADRVAISADHGNAMGEWGVYAHPLGVPIDCVKTVPWYTTTATDEETRTPPTFEKSDVDTTPLKERLQQLGYVPEH